jgi:transposase
VVAFCDAVKDVPPEKLVYLDEMGVHLGMTPARGRAPVGERALCYVPGNRGSNISVIAAVRQGGVLAWYPQDGAIDGERFLAFLRERLVPVLRPGDVVVMDNVRFHHIPEVATVIVSAGARVLYVPPYHPELNAIEEAFSVVKGAVRRLEPRTICDLVDALRAAFGRLTRKILEALVAHALAHAIQRQ